MSDRPFDQHASGVPSEPSTVPQSTTPPATGVATPLPATPAVPPPPAGGTGGSSGQSSTTDKAKQEAASVGQDAKESAGQVAQTAKEEVQHVATEAKGHAQRLLSEVRGDVTSQARDQQQRAASGLQALAGEFKQMASSSEGSSMAAGLVQQAADRVDGVAGWLENREPADLLEDLKRYARRNPGTFLAICGAVGLVAGRLTRGLREESMQQEQGQGGYGGYSGYDTAGSGTYGSYGAYGTGTPAAGGTTYESAADAGTYAPATGTPTSYATTPYPADDAILDEPLATGDDVLPREDGDRL